MMMICRFDGGVWIMIDKQNFLRIVMEDENISVEAKGLYAYIFVQTRVNDDCVLSTDEICTDLSISKGTLSKYMRELVDANMIKKEQIKEGRRFSHNMYILVDVSESKED